VVLATGGGGKGVMAQTPPVYSGGFSMKFRWFFYRLAIAMKDAGERWKFSPLIRLGLALRGRLYLKPVEGLRLFGGGKK
jgi:hypothetical protein